MIASYGATRATCRRCVVARAGQPGARRNGIMGIHAGALKVAVTQAAEKGKANQAVADVLCDALGLRPSQIELRSGDDRRGRSDS